MRIRKKLRESRLRTHQQIRAWLQPKLGKAGERLRLAGRIRLANIWAHLGAEASEKDFRLCHGDIIPSAGVFPNHGQ